MAERCADDSCCRLNERAAEDRIDNIKRKQQTFFNARIKLPEIKHPSYKTARDITSPNYKTFKIHIIPGNMRPKVHNIPTTKGSKTKHPN
jgi:hypothetical protein